MKGVRGVLKDLGQVVLSDKSWRATGAQDEPSKPRQDPSKSVSDHLACSSALVAAC